ncbi:MAG: hypothetical protein ACOCZH_02620 [Phototrophicaceae bacterium]
MKHRFFIAATVLFIVSGFFMGQTPPTAQAQELLPGSITVVKSVAFGDTSAVFDMGFFVPPSLDLDTPFQLSDGGSRTFAEQEPGTYAVAEDYKDGWQRITAADVSCTSEGGSTFSFADDPSRQRSGMIVNLAEGDDVTCTFTNRQESGSLTVDKVVDWNENDPLSPAPSFEICVSGPDSYSSCFNLSDGQSNPLTGLLPGTYTVSETDPGSDWIVSGEGDVTVIANETATSTITNTYNPPPPTPDPVTASAVCDGDDLLITWSGPTGWDYTVNWGMVAAPPGAMAVSPSGSEPVASSPYRLTGPGTWNNVNFVGSEVGGPGLEVVNLGDFTCETGDDPTPTPEPERVYQCTFDGRLNDDFCGYPIAVYRTADGYSIYAIDPDTAEGTLAFEVMSASGEAQLLAEGVHSFTNQPIEVYLLANGDIQINTFYADGKPYIFVISSSGDYHLAR